jgi:hypothetical protein
MNNLEVTAASVVGTVVGKFLYEDCIKPLVTYEYDKHVRVPNTASKIEQLSAEELHNTSKDSSSGAAEDLSRELWSLGHDPDLYSKVLDKMTEDSNADTHLPQITPTLFDGNQIGLIIRQGKDDDAGSIPNKSLLFPYGRELETYLEASRDRLPQNLELIHIPADH